MFQNTNSSIFFLFVLFSLEAGVEDSVSQRVRISWETEAWKRLGGWRGGSVVGMGRGLWGREVTKNGEWEVVWRLERWLNG